MRTKRDGKWRYLLLVLVLAGTASCQRTRNRGGPCRLSDEETRSLVDEDTRTWRVTDAVLEEHDLQDIFDCTRRQDTVALQTTQRIQPRSRIEISREVTINGSGRGRNRSSKATLTCPSRTEGLFLIKCAHRIGKIAQGCDLRSEASVRAVIETEDCTGSNNQSVPIQMLRVNFENNINRNGAAGLHVSDPSCYTLEMEDVEFRSNQYTTFAWMSLQNELNSVRLIGNKFRRGNDGVNAMFVFVSSRARINNLVSEANEGNILSILSSTLQMSDSHFSGNSGRGQSVIHISESSVSVTSTVFDSNFGRTAAALSLFNSTATFSSVRFVNNSASTSVGAVSISSGSNATFSSVHFVNNSALTSGGAVYMNTDGNATFSSVHFVNNSALTSGGAVYINTDGNATFSSVDFVNNSALTSGGAVHLTESQNAKFQSCIFKSNRAEWGGAVSVFGQPPSNSGRLKISDCLFEKNSASDYGGAIRFFNWSFSRIDIDASEFLHNKAQLEDTELLSYGGALYIADSEQMNLRVTNSVFKNNSAYFGAGSCIRNTGGRLIFKSVQYIQNNAGVGGGIYVWNPLQEELKMRSEDCLFRNNTALNSGGAVATNGEAVDAEISSSDFVDNYGNYAGGLWALTLKTLAITHCNFRANEARWDGGALSIGSVSSGKELAAAIQATISASSFVRNTATRGGALKSDTAVYVSQCEFQKNRAHGHGGGVFVSEAPIRSVFRRTNFINNRAAVGGALVATSGLTFIINAVRVDIREQCHFERNRAAVGGALFLLLGRFGDIYHITNSTFVRNEAVIGGGLYVQADGAFLGPGFQIVEMHGTTLNENHARWAGGACFIENLDALVTDCELDAAVPFSADTDAFSNNFNCDIMVDNSVGKRGHGPNIAASATSFYAILIPSEERNDIQLGAGSTKSVRDLKSGDVFPHVKFIMVDPFHQGPALAKTHTGLPEVDTDLLHQTTNVGCFAKGTVDSEDGLIPNQLIADVSSGEGIVTVGAIHQRPGDYSLSVWTGDDKSNAITLRVSLRECIVNEESIQGGKLCLECDKDRYNFHPANGTCKQCPDNCDCSYWGLKPEKNYWIPSPCSTAVKECLSDSACDYDERETKLEDFYHTTEPSCDEIEVAEDFNQRQCNEGHEGRLCGSCSEGYGEFDLECYECASKAVIVLWILAITVWNLGAVSINVIGNLAGGKMLHRLGRHVTESIKSTQKSLIDVHAGKGTSGQSTTPLRTTSSESKSSWKSVEFAQVGGDDFAQCPTNEKQNELHVRAEEPTQALASPFEQPNAGGNVILEDTIRFAGTAELPPDKETKNVEQSEIDDAKRNVIETIKLLLNFAQVVSMALAINADWTSLAEGALKALSSLGSVGLETTISFDCLFSKSSSVPRSVKKVMISLIPPFAVLLIMAAFWLTRFHENLAVFRRRLVLSAVVVFYMAYIGWATILSSALHCVTIDDGVTVGKYWTQDTSVECFTGSHAALTFSLVIPMILVALFAFPIGSAYYLYLKKQENKLNTVLVKEKFGFMYGAYKAECFYWDGIVMLRKAALALAIVFGASLGGNMQGLISICILAVSVYLQARFWPFDEQFHDFNLIEVLSLLVCQLTFIFGVFLNDERIGQSGRTFVSLVAMLLITGYVLFVAYIALSKFVYFCKLDLKANKPSEAESVDELGAFRVCHTWLRGRLQSRG